MQTDQLVRRTFSTSSSRECQEDHTIHDKKLNIDTPKSGSLRKYIIDRIWGPSPPSPSTTSYSGLNETTIDEAHKAN